MNLVIHYICKSERKPKATFQQRLSAD